MRVQLEGAERYAPLHLGLETSELELAGYLAHRELSLGDGRRLVVISQMRGAPGQLLLFAESEALADRIEVDYEVASYTLCDLDEDGISEVILDQLEGWGTDIYLRRFVLFRAGAQLAELWSGVSLSSHDLAGTDVTESERGSVQCQPSGGANLRPRLVHTVKTTSQDGESWRVESFEIQDGRLVQVENPATALQRTSGTETD